MAQQPILDIRSEPEFIRWHFPHSVNIPLGQLARRMYELPEKGSALSIYDDDPVRALAAIELLTQRGYVVSAADEQETYESGPSSERLWAPSPLVEEAAGLMGRQGDAADLACGSGRDAVWLAMQGWRVCAVDVLPDALANARDLGERNGVKLELVKRDLVKEPSLEEGRMFDLICVVRFWHEPLVRWAAGALRPGGLLAVETFGPADANGEERDRSRLVTPDELVAATSGLEAVALRETQRGGRHYSQIIARR